MVSVLAIRSEVFGSCVEEIDVSVGMDYRGVWLCCGWKYLTFVLVRKVLQDLLWRWEMVPGIGGLLRLVGGG
jgi:hypothetical protein